MTFGLAAVMFLVAAIILLLAILPVPEPYASRLVPVGLFFIALGLLVGSIGA
jgi:hypothetical protein